MNAGKLDLSISLGRANLLAVLIVPPLLAFQTVPYYAIHGTQKMEYTWSLPILSAVILLGIAVHELIHGVTWAIASRRPLFKAIEFGFSWKTLTPFAHVKEPLEVNAYRIGTLRPILVLGILPYFLALAFADGNLFLFSLFHTMIGVGDLLILWLIRNVTSGAFVEDHPTRAGCYVIER
jgi:hypothetical protein